MKLSTTIREKVGTNFANQMRKQDRVPAVLYGRGDAQAIGLELAQVEALLGSHERMVELDLGGSVEQAVLQDVQFDTFGREVLHMDFKRVAVDETVRLSVALNFTGTPKGVMAGGICDFHKVDLEIVCAAKDIPTSIEVPLGPLEIGDVLHVDEIPMPAGVTPAGDPRAAVAQVIAKKKKKAKGEAAGEGAAAAEAAGGAAEEG